MKRRLITGIILVSLLMLQLPQRTWAEEPQEPCMEEPAVQEAELPEAEELPWEPLPVEEPEQVGKTGAGTCGSLTWELGEDGTLTVSGAGAIPEGESMPWRPLAGSVRYVVLEEGVSQIGSRAFADCSGMIGIAFPTSLCWIGSGAFRDCVSLAEVSYAGNDSQWTWITIEEDNEPLLTAVLNCAYTPVEMAFTLVNNQCVRVRFSRPLDCIGLPDHYLLLNAAGESLQVSGALQSSEVCCQLTFPDPLPAGSYRLIFENTEYRVEGAFAITLDLKVIQAVDARNVIVQLNAPIYGCTESGNYWFRSLAGNVVQVIGARSAFADLGEALPNVFCLTTDRDLTLGTTYIVETRAMSLDAAGQRPCQGTIAYFTPEAFSTPENVTVTGLTNNQSVIFHLPANTSGRLSKANYSIRSSDGREMAIGSVRSVGTDTVEVNFVSPLPEGHYTLTSRNMSRLLKGSFTISLDMQVLRIESSSVIIRLSQPVYGCTEPWSYFAHRLGSPDKIPAVRAESVFAELGGQYTNVFRVTFPESLAAGQTYIMETRRMALDAGWEQPCQGTIAYFTPAAQPDVNYRALLIGEMNYAAGTPYANLSACGFDVTAMANMLGTVNGGVYHIQRLLDADKSDIRSAIQSAFAAASENDVSLFYYSGHGMVSEGPDSGALCTISGELIRTEELAAWLSGIPGKVIVIIDACGSGAAIDKGTADASAEAFGSGLIAAFAAAEQDVDVLPKAGELCTGKFYVLTACAAAQTSSAFPTYSLFTGWLTAGVTRNPMPADCNTDGRLTLAELHSYITEKAEGWLQAPQVYPENSDYVVFVK